MPLLQIAGLLLLFTTLTITATADDDMMPPHGSRIVTDAVQGVLFHWPGSPKERYFLQIYAGTVPSVEQEITGNIASVPLRAGLGYQWKVSLIEKSGGYREIVPNRSFQVTPESQVLLNGANGSDGKPGNRASAYRGHDGGQGKPGYNLTATLTPAGKYVNLLVTGAPANRQFYFAPGAGPLLITSLGGQGGTGGPGHNGRNADFNLNTGFISPPEPGGPGGQGGDGGPGGNITVISHGLNVDQYLLFDTRGGPGGAAGPGGRGGEGANIPPEWQYRLPQGYGYGLVRAPSGPPGRPGNPGTDGQIILR